jgi:hypothetical protein
MHLTGNLLNQQELSSRKVTPAQVFERLQMRWRSKGKPYSRSNWTASHGGDEGLETRDFFRDGMEESRN